MNNADLEKIVNKLITDSFPELMSQDVEVKWKKMKDACMSMGEFRSNEGFYLRVDKGMKDANKSTLIGGIAHELSHMVDALKLGKKLARKDKIAYKISKRYRTLDERNTDLQVIIRGYGAELLEFMHYSQKNGFQYYEEDGLSIREIQAILNQPID